MAPQQPLAKYQYVVTSAGPKILPAPDAISKDEESPADYNAGGYLHIKLKDTFKDGRYVVLRKLGWGHFSTVWLVKDDRANCHSALKVVKSAGRYAETARDEIKLLAQVKAANPSHPGRDHVVSFLDSFEHEGPEDSHICIVFEPLGENLLALIERNKKTGVSPALVKVIAKQILLGLRYLHDECQLVHTDIKPENIMISIPDVESHIQTELQLSPSPTCRKVGVPPKQIRGGIAIPRRPVGRERHVQIFDSQPLASPSSYSPVLAGSSPGRPSFQFSRMTSAQNVLKVDVSVKQAGKQGSGSAGSGELSSDFSGSLPLSSAFASSSFPTSTSVKSVDTMATSVGSIVPGLAKVSIASSPTIYSCICEKQPRGLPPDHEGQPGSSTSQMLQPKPNVGPSLLSQTAPTRLSDLPACPSCSSPTSPTSRQDALLGIMQVTPPITIKIADLGNATPIHKHYAEDIQTRQYRSPEVILGRTDWGPTADIWSTACVVFELLTAEYLLDPQSQGDVFGKDDDHMAQIIELLGDFQEDFKFGGRFSRELFDSSGALRYIRSLKPWPLERVMIEKYLWSEEDSEALCQFLKPMLAVDHRQRMHAWEMIHHPWLEVDLVQDDFSAC